MIKKGNELTASELLFSDLISKIEKEFPFYSTLKYSQSKLQISDVQKALIPKTAVIEYFIGEKKSYAILITKNESKILPIA